MRKTHLYEPFNKPNLKDKVVDFVSEHKRGLGIGLGILLLETAIVSGIKYMNHVPQEFTYDSQEKQSFVNYAAQKEKELKEKYKIEYPEELR